jgi:hypothetical protein
MRTRGSIVMLALTGLISLGMLSYVVVVGPGTNAGRHATTASLGTLLLLFTVHSRVSACRADRCDRL